MLKAFISFPKDSNLIKVAKELILKQKLKCPVLLLMVK